MKKWMELEARRISAPYERSHVIDEDVTNVRSARAARYRELIDPLRSKSWCIFFIEELAANPVGETFQCDRAFFEVRQEVGRDPDIVIDNLRLSETVLWIKNLIEIRQPNVMAANVQFL